MERDRQGFRRFVGRPLLYAVRLPNLQKQQVTQLFDSLLYLTEPSHLAPRLRESSNGTHF